MLARAEGSNSMPLSLFTVSGMTGLTLRLYHRQLLAQTAVSDLYVCEEYNKTVSLINMCSVPPSVRQAGIGGVLTYSFRNFPLANK